MIEIRRKILRMVGAAVFWAAPAIVMASPAWVQDLTSPALQYAGRHYVLKFDPHAMGTTPGSGVPRDATITAVHVRRHYQSDFIVQSQLCRQPLQDCVPINGRQLTTHAFDGTNAQAPLYIVHTIAGKGPLPLPIFVKSGITVHYHTPDAGNSRHRQQLRNER